VNALALCGGLAVLVFSRLHYAPKYLFYFDNANFALALRRFDPALHQPQPPGYPLFVALLHLIDAMVGNPNRSLLVVGLVGSVAALALLWVWADRMCGRIPAHLATALLLFHPVFWLAGVVNPVRVFLAAAVTGTGLCAWETMTSATPMRALYWTAATLGLLAGFRPDALILLAPLCLTVGIYRKVSPKILFLAVVILAASTSVWLLPMAARLGGLGSLWQLFSAYVRERSAGYTVAYGASTEASLATIRRALVWTLGMTVVWIWVIPFVWGRFASFWDRPRILLVAAALLPALLFHGLVHIRDIDQTLISIPVTCLVGGVVLASIPSRKAMIAVSVVAIFASAWSFRRPIFPEMRAASGSAIRYVDDWTKSTYAALDQIKGEPGTLAVWYDAVVPWRNVTYYYPALPLLVVSEEGSHLVNGGEERLTVAPDGSVAIPRFARKLVLGLSYEEAKRAEQRWPRARRVGPLILLDLEGGESLEIGTLRLHAGH
jgi:hypothetical protein